MLGRASVGVSSWESVSEELESVVEEPELDDEEVESDEEELESEDADLALAELVVISWAFLLVCCACWCVLRVATRASTAAPPRLRAWISMRVRRATAMSAIRQL